MDSRLGSANEVTLGIGTGVVSAVVGLIVDALIGRRRQGASTYWEPKGPSFTLK